MKKKLLAALALSTGIAMLSSCAGVISFPEKVTDPGVPLWKEPETKEPSDPAALHGVWYAPGFTNVFRFAEGGVLTVWGLTPGYDYEYSNSATGTYTYDGKTLTMTIGSETVTRTCEVENGTVTFDGTVTMQLQTEEPKAHPSYPYPDFEALAAGLPLLSADTLTGQTIAATGKRLQAAIQLKNTYFAGRDLEKKTEGTAVLGDMVNIDYSGKLDGVAFGGGTAVGANVTVAPDTGYIPGFCEGIAGHTIGETFDVTVTFPETYGNAELAGKEVVFTMTLNAIYDTTVTDEMVAAYEENAYTTVEEWENAIRQDLITESVWALIPALADLEDGTDAYLYYYQDMLDFYHYYAAAYGVNFEQFLLIYTGQTVADLETESRTIVRNYLLAAVVVRALNLTPDKDWVSAFTEGYLSRYLENGYTEEQARELISSGDGLRMYRAALLLDFAADHLTAHNTFTD